MTKIWINSTDAADYTEARMLNDIGEHLNVYMRVTACQSLIGLFPDTRLQIVSDSAPSDYFEAADMFIVSSRLRTLLEQFHVHAEFFPIEVLDRNLELSAGDFYFCNILDCIEGFDLKNGSYVFWRKAGFTDHVKTVRKLAIDEAKAAPYNLFRLAKCSPVIVGASDSLARNIQEQGFTGIRFVEPIEWRFGL